MGIFNWLRIAADHDPDDELVLEDDVMFDDCLQSAREMGDLVNDEKDEPRYLDALRHHLML